MHHQFHGLIKLGRIKTLDFVEVQGLFDRQGLDVFEGDFDRLPLAIGLKLPAVVMPRQPGVFRLEVDDVGLTIAFDV